MPLNDAPETRPSLLRAALPYAASAFLTLLLYAPYFLPGAHLLVGDYTDQNFTFRYFATSALAAGHLPHWTTNIFGGYPFLSDVQTAVFCPTNLILYFLAPRPLTLDAMDAFVVINVIVLALGATFLARTLGIGPVGAVAAATLMAHNGMIPNHLGHVQFNQLFGLGYIYIGVLIRVLRRPTQRGVIGCGLLGAWVILVGFPQIAMHIFAAAGVAAVIFALRGVSVRASLTPLAVLGATMILSFLGALVQILPTSFFLEMTPRRLLDLTTAHQYSLPVSALPGLLAPGLFQILPALLKPGERWMTTPYNTLEDGYWEYYYYIGLTALLLGVIGWAANASRLRAWSLGILTAILVLCALGPAVGLYEQLYNYVPGFKQVRIPTRLLWIAWSAWGLLAGMGVDALCRAAERPDGNLSLARKTVYALLIAAVLAVLVTVAVQWAGTRSLSAAVLDFCQLPADRRENVAMRHRFLINFAVQAAVSAVTAAAIVSILILLKRRPRLGPTLGVLAVVLLAGELGFYGFHKNIIIDPGRKTTPAIPNFYAVLPETMAGRFLFDSSSNSDKNQAMIAGLNYASGYAPTQPLWHGPFAPWETSPHGQQNHENARDIWNLTHYIMNTTGVQARLASRDVKLPFRGSVPLDATTGFPADRRTAVVENGTSIGRVFLLSNAGAVAGLPNDLEVGQLILADATDTAYVTLPLRLGHETAEWSYDLPIHPGPLGHAKPAVAFRAQDAPDQAGPANFYKAVFQAPTTFTLGRITVRATAEAPAFLCVSHLILERGDRLEIHPVSEGFSTIVEPSPMPQYTLLRRPTALGYAWGVPTGTAVSYRDDYEYVRRKYWDPAFDPRREVLLNKKQITSETVVARNAADPSAFRATTEYKKPAPEETEISADFNQPGWLVISELWYPGWTATLDGKPVDLIRANGAHSAVAVPAGKHMVRLSYETPRFAIGAAVSAATWLLGLLAMLVPARSRRN
ncbi:MAG: YfhO family protein [Candidatus Sumerlaeaceae bacterium]|nr:YfhO family protein [Candidatus Sumerlaeaceae bacterium]